MEGCFSLIISFFALSNETFLFLEIFLIWSLTSSVRTNPGPIELQVIFSSAVSRALETAEENITCNSIGPGFVLTELVNDQIKKISKKRKVSFDKAKKDIISEKHPSKKFVDKSDVSKMVYYLTTDEAAQITGSNLIIDGGWSAQ